MSLLLDGTTGVPVTTVTGTLPVANGGSGVTTSTGTGANVLGTSPTITGATITVASTAAPAFSAYLSSAQTITAGATTKIAFDAEFFDTNNNFDSTTNRRFTPTVAGYYQINSNSCFSFASPSTSAYANLNVYKNGSLFAQIGGQCASANANYYNISGSTLVSMNGSTDYIEIFIGNNNGGNLTLQLVSSPFGGNMVSGFLARSA